MKELKIKHTQIHAVDTNSPNFKFDVAYEQGSEGGEMEFLLVCKNVPIGSTVGFESNRPGPNPPIFLPPTKVVAFPSFTVGEISQVPANYSCVITCAGVINGTPPANVSIELRVAYIVGSE